MREIADNLFCFEDICNVYILRSGSNAVLIDFGCGEVLDRLGTIGVKQITAILMTHHHRDQGQGLGRAVKMRIPIWVPQTEQDLFANIEQHWQAREVYNNYNVRQDRYSILESIHIAGTLHDYSTYTYGTTTITVIPTPGHTIGSITLLTEMDGKRIAFTGDLISGPGKVWSMSAIQWTYNGAEGAAASVLSLLDLKDRKLDLLLPSHGEPMNNPTEAVELLVDRFLRLLQVRNQHANLLQLRSNPFKPITPHLLLNKTCFANSYVLLSKSGKALIIDYGYDFNIGLAAGADRASRRPWLQTIDVLKRDYAVNKIDVVMPTHYHDDHVAGINLLKEVEGAEVWAAENFADLLEHPSKYDLPCLWYDPIRVDHKLPLGRSITWEEYEFTLYEQPGHTLYAVVISLEVDGKRVLAIGDQQGNDEGLWNYVYKNRFRIADYKDSAELYLSLQPDLIVSGHWDPLWVEPGYLESLRTKGETLEQLHRELLPLETLDLGAEGFGAWIRPYQLTAFSGDKITLEVEVLNPLSQEEDILVRLITPPDWELDEQEIALRLLPHNNAKLKFHLQLPHKLQVRRARVAADITAGKQKLGQQAEALITVVDPNEQNREEDSNSEC